METSPFLKKLESSLPNVIDFPDRDEKEAKELLEIMQNNSEISDISKAINTFIYSRNYPFFSHQIRVGLVSAEIARLMNLPSHLKNATMEGGLVHDIGKMFWSACMHDCKNKLSLDDIQSHTADGIDLLAGTELLENKYIQQIVYNHHTNLDLTGYPNNLKGENFFTPTKIVSVVDRFDAMTTRSSNRDRIFDGPLSNEQAFQILRKSAYLGKVDEEIVEVLYDLQQQYRRTFALIS